MFNFGSYVHVTPVWGFSAVFLEFIDTRIERAIIIILVLLYVRFTLRSCSVSGNIPHSHRSERDAIVFPSFSVSMKRSPFFERHFPPVSNVCHSDCSIIKFARQTTRLHVALRLMAVADSERKTWALDATHAYTNVILRRLTLAYRVVARSAQDLNYIMSFSRVHRAVTDMLLETISVIRPDSAERSMLRREWMDRLVSHPYFESV